MKLVTTLGIILLCSMTAVAQQSILGRWNTRQENTVIEVKEVKGKIEGRIVASDHAKAPIGMLLLKDIHIEELQMKGKLFALRKGQWFDASFSPKQNNMEVTLIVGWVTRKLNWRKLY
jgi:hypothetical protein